MRYRKKKFVNLQEDLPHDPYHADLYFYYKPTKDGAFQFFAIANNAKENYQGIDYFFTLFFCPSAEHTFLQKRITCLIICQMKPYGNYASMPMPTFGNTII